jgi:hypothetical protein
LVVGSFHIYWSGAEASGRPKSYDSFCAAEQVTMLNVNNTSHKRLLTDEQLAGLGGGQIAYLRSIRSEELSRLFPAAPLVQPGLQLFALLAADGTPIAVTDSRDAAVANAMSHDLEMVSLH